MNECFNPNDIKLLYVSATFFKISTLAYSFYSCNFILGRKKDFGFIIDEAEVDDEVEDEDEWEEGAQEIGIVPNEVDEFGPTAREIEGRRRGTNLWE